MFRIRMQATYPHIRGNVILKRFFAATSICRFFTQGKLPHLQPQPCRAVILTLHCYIIILALIQNHFWVLRSAWWRFYRRSRNI